MHRPRCDVGDHGNDPQPAESKKRDHLIIIAGIQLDLSIRQCHQFCNLADIARRLLDADDVRHIPHQPCHGLRQHIHTRPGRHIVNQQRTAVHSVRHRPVVQIESLLRPLVIIRRDQQQRVRAVLRCLF